TRTRSRSSSTMRTWGGIATLLSRKPGSGQPRPRPPRVPRSAGPRGGQRRRIRVQDGKGPRVVLEQLQRVGMATDPDAASSGQGRAAPGEPLDAQADDLLCFLQGQQVAFEAGQIAVAVLVGGELRAAAALRLEFLAQGGGHAPGLEIGAQI